jgi:hypothetical protein
VFSVPGTEARKAIAGRPMSASFTLNDKITLAGFYQYKWEETRLNGGRLFRFRLFRPRRGVLSTSTGVITALLSLFTGSTRWRHQTERLRPVGLGARFQVTDATEIGLYHYRYRPCRRDVPDFGRYPYFLCRLQRQPARRNHYFKLAYFDDIKLTGVSFAQDPDTVQYAAELSYATTRFT